MNDKPSNYYVPEQSVWPIFGAVGVTIVAIGAANTIQQSTDKVANEGSFGWLILLTGIAILIYTMARWFGDTIHESMAGKNSTMLDTSYRMGMIWFIFSEVMFFATFFGALFYVRQLSVPWLGGEDMWTHTLLWPDFVAQWPLLTTPSGNTTEAMGPWGLPLINTMLLLSSGATITYAHYALKKQNRRHLIAGLSATVLLGFTFLGVQAYEYQHAYQSMNLTIDAGVYGATFYMLTGFHGLHVTIGATMIAIMLIRSSKGHFSPDNHFAFEATAWYWHFVDFVWLLLFVVVYWL